MNYTVLPKMTLGVESLCQNAKRFGLIQSIVHAFDEDVFKRDHASTFGLVVIQRGGEFFERILAVHRHDSSTHVIRRAVQRDGEGELFRLVCELADLRREAAGGNRDLPRADASAPRRIQQAQSSEQIVVVGERFAHAHDDEIVHEVTAGEAAACFTRGEGRGRG